MSETASRRPFLGGLAEQWRGHPITVLAGMALVMALGVLVLQVACSKQGVRTVGDEPPIRVKGGSIHLNLVTKKGGDKWRKDSGWIATMGKRGDANYNSQLLSLPAGVGDGCALQYKLEKKETVTITYEALNDDGSVKADIPITVDVRQHDDGTGKKDWKTTVTANGLNLVPRNGDYRWLDDETKGFISKLEIKDPSSGKSTVCTFEASDFADIAISES